MAKVKSPLGNSTDLTVSIDIEVWGHIQKGHPEIQDVEDVKRTLTQPNTVQRSHEDSSVLYYYRLLVDGPKKFRGLFMLAVVQQDDDMSGFLKTAFLCRKTKSGGELLWMRH